MQILRKSDYLKSGASIRGKLSHEKGNRKKHSRHSNSINSTFNSFLIELNSS